MCLVILCRMCLVSTQGPPNIEFSCAAESSAKLPVPSAGMRF